MVIYSDKENNVLCTGFEYATIKEAIQTLIAGEGHTFTKDPFDKGGSFWLEELTITRTIITLRTFEKRNWRKHINKNAEKKQVTHVSLVLHIADAIALGEQSYLELNIPNKLYNYLVQCIKNKKENSNEKIMWETIYQLFLIAERPNFEVTSQYFKYRSTYLKTTNHGI